MTSVTTPRVSTFCVAFPFFVPGRGRDFKFGMGLSVDRSKSQPTDYKPPLTGRGQVT